jgi:hypothetical protein
MTNQYKFSCPLPIEKPQGESRFLLECELTGVTTEFRRSTIEGSIEADTASSFCLSRDVVASLSAAWPNNRLSIVSEALREGDHHYNRVTNVEPVPS